MGCWKLNMDWPHPRQAPCYCTISPAAGWLAEMLFSWLGIKEIQKGTRPWVWSLKGGTTTGLWSASEYLGAHFNLVFIQEETHSTPVQHLTPHCPLHKEKETENSLLGQLWASALVALAKIKSEDLHLVVTSIKGCKFSFRLILICLWALGGLIKTAGEPKSA